MRDEEQIARKNVGLFWHLFTYTNCVFGLRHLASLVHIISCVCVCVCSPSPIRLLEAPGCFEDVKLKLLLIFLCAAKNGNASGEVLFLDYTCKAIQNIQWGRGARGPRLLPSFTNFVSVKWTWLWGRAWLCNGTRAIHECDAWSSWFWFTGTHILLQMCVCVCVLDVVSVRDSLWRHDREPLLHNSASILSNKVALLYCKISQLALKWSSCDINMHRHS